MLMGVQKPGSAAQSETISPKSEAELSSFVAECHATARSLHIVGGGTRTRLSAPLAETQLTTRSLDGVVAYEPGELTLIARAGASVDEIERMLAAEGQALAFEPMDHRVLLGSNGTPTLGGMVAANVSGPRRLQAGACRDHLLGVRFVDGRGRVIKNGGRVMKNVTGMDLGKLMSGSNGTLGILTEVSLKTLPVAESQQTLAFAGVTPGDAVGIFSAALATPFEVSGAAFHDGTAWLRVEGLTAQVAYRRERLSALFRDREIDIVDDAGSRTLWRDLRDVRHFADNGEAVWRILVKPTDAPGVIDALSKFGGRSSLDWGGGLLWYSGEADAEVVRRAAGTGVAVLVRPGPASDQQAHPPVAPGIAALTAAIRQTFDPAGILNPGYMSN